MANPVPIKNIEEDQKADRAILEKISKIITFLKNIED